jgi:glycosyltransferase involved in cell wall biosynthesis
MRERIVHINLARGFRGGERQTELLIQHLADQGVAQVLVCRALSPLREHLAGTATLRFVTADHQLQGHFAVPESGLLHAHEAKAVHWAWIHHLLHGVPYVLTRRVTHPVRDNFFNRLCYRSAKAAVAISSPIAAHLRQRGWTSVRTIPSALARLPHDPTHAAELRARYRGKFVIGHAGALVDAHKGQREVITAARLLRDRAPDVHFLMLGDGPDGAALRAESRDLPNMEWLGFRNNLGDYLAALDLFVFPSRYEGLGSTLLDVMDFSVPIIASDVDGIPDIVVHEETGLLVPPNDGRALAEAISRLRDDPSLRLRLTREAARRLENFRPEVMASRYLALYRELVAI